MKKLLLAAILAFVGFNANSQVIVDDEKSMIKTLNILNLL